MSRIFYLALNNPETNGEKNLPGRHTVMFSGKNQNKVRVTLSYFAEN